MENIRQRWSHSTEIFGTLSNSGRIYSEGGRAFRAELFIDDYAAGVARAWYNDLLSLMSDDVTQANKTPALAAMLVYGKDIYFSIYNGNERVRYWGAGAGQHVAKFPPAVLFAALSKNKIYADNLKKVSSTTLNLNDLGPHELDQDRLGLAWLS